MGTSQAPSTWHDNTGLGGHRVSLKLGW